MKREMTWTLVAAFAWFAVAADRVGAQENPLPTAQEVITNYIRTLGGEETLEAISSVRMTASQTVSEPGQSSSHEHTFTYLRSSDKWTYAHSMNGKSGFDGTRRWFQIGSQQPEWRADDRQTKPEPGYSLYAINECDPVAYSLFWLSFAQSLEVKEIVEVDGQAAYRLVVTQANSEPTVRMDLKAQEILVDVNTGLLKQVRYQYKTCHFSDYRECAGVLIPWRKRIQLRFETINVDYDIRITTFDPNPQLDDALFVAPVKDNDDQPGQSRQGRETGDASSPPPNSFERRFEEFKKKRSQDKIDKSGPHPRALERQPADQVNRHASEPATR